MTVAQAISRQETIRDPKFIGNEPGLTQYMREIKNIRTLSMAEEAELARKIRQGDRKALNELITANLRFVVSVCRNYRNQGLSMGDLINEGNLGLIRAARRFDESKNFKFISYAVWWIRQSILQTLAEHSRILKVPLSRVGDIRRLGKSGSMLEQKLGRSITSAELSQHLSLKDNDVQECAYLNSFPISLDSPRKGFETGSFGECLKDDNAEKPDASILSGDLKGEIKSVLDTLDIRETEVLKLYFGIGGESAYTLEEIGSRFNLTRERVRQIKEKGLARLKHASRSQRLAAFRA
jgi:RNA polymerase primary sigma factor